MSKKILTVFIAVVVTILFAFPGIVNAEVNTDDYLVYYDFNNYAGTGDDVIGRKEGGTPMQGTLGEKDNAHKIYLPDKEHEGRDKIGGKAENDKALVYKIADLSADTTYNFGPWNDGASTELNYIYSCYSTNNFCSITVEYDLYDDTSDGTFTLVQYSKVNGKGVETGEWKFDNLSLTKGKWHNVAVEIKNYGIDNNNRWTESITLYVDGRQAKKNTYNYTSGVHPIYLNYPYLCVNAKAGDSGIMAIDNYKIYQRTYEGLSEYYHNDFSKAAAADYDEFTITGNDCIIDNASGFYGKASDDSCLTFTYNSDNDSLGDVLNYTNDITDYAGVVTTDMSFCDTTLGSEHIIEPSFVSDGTTLGGPKLTLKRDDVAYSAYVEGVTEPVFVSGTDGNIISGNQWHRLAVTSDSENDTIRYLLDGVLLYETGDVSFDKTSSFKWTTVHPKADDPGVVAFDDFRVSKGEYDTDGNMVSLLSSDDNIVVKDNYVNIMYDGITDTELVSNLSVSGECQLSDPTLSEGSVLTVFSANGEMLYNYTLYYDDVIVRDVTFSEDSDNAGKLYISAKLCIPDNDILSSAALVAVIKDADGNVMGVCAKDLSKLSGETNEYEAGLSTPFDDEANAEVFFINNWNDCKIVRNKTYTR